MAQTHTQTGDNLIAFPRADLRQLLGTAMKRHRLPENLGQALVREAANFPEVSADAALAFIKDKPGVMNVRSQNLEVRTKRKKPKGRHSSRSSKL